VVAGAEEVPRPVPAESVSSPATVPAAVRSLPEPVNWDGVKVPVKVPIPPAASVNVPETCELSEPRSAGARQ
jgi:hypothetical protein